MQYFVDLNQMALLTEAPLNTYSPHAITPTIPVEVGKPYYLLAVEYSTGNSYGRSPGSYFEFVDLYVEKQKADEQARVIRLHADQSRGFKPEQRHVIYYANGAECPSPTWPWNGYFEKIERIFVVEVQIRKAKAFEEF